MERRVLTNCFLVLLVLFFDQSSAENSSRKKIISDLAQQIDNRREVTSDDKIYMGSTRNLEIETIESSRRSDPNYLNEDSEIRSNDEERQKASNKRTILVRQTTADNHSSTTANTDIIGSGNKGTSIGIEPRKDDRLLTRSLTLEKKPNQSTKDKKDRISLPVQNNTQVLAQVGGTATLSCYTGHISDEVVTWLKREDDQLLTIGQELYANEARFSASLSHSTKAWELFVQDVQISDAGQYECQLTTHPPVTFLFTLKVTQAKADIGGPREVHIEEGSQLDLQCIVKDSPSPPIYIFWIHNGTMVNYESQRGLEVHLKNFVSTLIISKVTPSDAGIYTCDPHLAVRANVIVHVVTGDKPAAMQHGRNPVNGSGSVTSHFGSSQYDSSLACVFLLLLPSVIIQLQNIFLCASIAVPTASCYHSHRSDLVKNHFQLVK